MNAYAAFMAALQAAAPELEFAGVCIMQHWQQAQPDQVKGFNLEVHAWERGDKMEMRNVATITVAYEFAQAVGNAVPMALQQLRRFLPSYDKQTAH